MQTAKRSKGKHPVRTLVFLTNPTVMLIAIIFFLLSWRIPTHVQLDLVVEQTFQAIPVEEVMASLQPGNNQIVSIQEGTISYPEYPDISPVTFVFPTQIEFEAKGEFEIEEIRLESEGKRHLRFDGIVTHLSTGTPDAFQDRRLTQFDRVRSSRRAVWIGIGAWLIATAIGWYRVYQELKE
jgi:hypothetical protein